MARGDNLQLFSNIQSMQAAINSQELGSEIGYNNQAGLGIIYSKEDLGFFVIGDRESLGDFIIGNKVELASSLSGKSDMPASTILLSLVLSDRLNVVLRNYSFQNILQSQSLGLLNISGLNFFQAHGDMNAFFSSAAGLNNMLQFLSRPEL